MKIRKVCIHCGSADVRADAWAEWNEEKQEWTLAEVYDNKFCISCEDETHIIDEEINE